MGRTAIHPGEILGEELAVIGVSASELARQLSVSASRVRQILNGQSGITADTALRLSKWFGTSPSFWLNLQKSYELRLAQAGMGEDLKKIQARKASIPPDLQAALSD